MTGIRYVDCPASGDGGSGTGDGSGTGTGDGSGTGDGGSGTGDGNTATGSGTAADGGTGEAGDVVINAEGTPVDAITGLPNTGQGSGFQASGTAAMWLALAIAGAVAVVGRLLASVTLPGPVEGGGSGKCWLFTDGTITTMIA